MTAPHARQPEVLPRQACTPTAIRAVLAACAGGDVLRWYDEDLDTAFEQARAQGDVTSLVQTVKRWWFEADAWRDPQAQREFLARIDAYRDGGPPPAERRMSREDIRAQSRAASQDPVARRLATFGSPWRPYATGRGNALIGRKAVTFCSWHPVAAMVGVDRAIGANSAISAIGGTAPWYP